MGRACTALGASPLSPVLSACRRLALWSQRTLTTGRSPTFVSNESATRSFLPDQSKSSMTECVHLPLSSVRSVTSALSTTVALGSVYGSTVASAAVGAAVGAAVAPVAVGAAVGAAEPPSTAVGAAVGAAEPPSTAVGAAVGAAEPLSASPGGGATLGAQGGSANGAEGGAAASSAAVLVWHVSPGEGEGGGGRGVGGEGEGEG